MELLVVRHGQSEADILGRHEGRADYDLTEFSIFNGDTAVHLWRIEGAKRYIGFMNSQEHLL